MTTPTGEFIQKLASLRAGDLGRLRKHAGLSLDESVDGFDLFAGLWWPLREKNQRAPRREIAWLIAKLYAFCPLPQTDGATLASQLGKVKASDDQAREKHQQRFDDLLSLPLSQIEPALQGAITVIASIDGTLDWVRLTDELSWWEREETRTRWAREFLQLSC
jgi:CRISPR type I-E-associated protein CasB/Cse2